MKDIFTFLNKKLNNDVLICYIFPFSITPQSNLLLRDIRSFVTDIAIIDSIYSTQFNPQILQTDLTNYYNNNIPSKIKVNMFYSGLDERITNFKNRRLLATMSPEERTHFINIFIL